MKLSDKNRARLRKVTRIAFQVPPLLKAHVSRAFRRTSPVLEMIDGTRTHASGHYAIFLIWQPDATPWYVQNALDALNAARINVLLVVNHALTPERRQEFARQCAKIMLRDNTGFDIGGFQDGTRYLLKTTEAERVLYLNDSIYFFKAGLVDLFQRLTTSPSAVCGTFENWEIHHHIQSFCFSVAGETLRHPEITRFWDGYLPANCRQWAIRRGEMGFSRALRPVTNDIEIIYNKSDLLPHLKSLPASEIANLIRYLPGWLRFTPKSEKWQNLGTLIGRLELCSQIHSGGFLFRRFMGCPLMKRDLVFHEQFKAEEVAALLAEMGAEGHEDDILADLCRKGDGSELKGIQRLRNWAGVS